jgi:hypothetical protein
MSDNIASTTKEWLDKTSTPFQVTEENIAKAKEQVESFIGNLKEIFTEKFPAEIEEAKEKLEAFIAKI